MWEWEFPVLP
ncbi:Protein of unknown function [Lactobacillus acidophilus DSM 9126]|nr:Protein of unknown function [Lactobacillus acidophilus DSM 20079 = JCM 1132 = NBRC 13951 = CIP 76.13]CDF70318.1 Protein of unknown function [Lactobacillus acidophilus CIRM-BIA 442]CDF72114.1 Protein of unknown function [Lactobacillus acidophilus CIRM-BIA 445]CDF73938.1 Protein of unknown function [Lactobacillus acidophilus DSM 9126]CDF75940.1 Protein of unknown function [Lactobacillus acidophilus DSM 20242]